MDHLDALRSKCLGSGLSDVTTQATKPIWFVGGNKGARDASSLLARDTNNNSERRSEEFRDRHRESGCEN
jgi:hypothetical protein